MDGTDGSASSALPGRRSAYVFDSDLVTYVCEVETMSISSVSHEQVGPKHIPIWRITVYGMTRTMREVRSTDLITIDRHAVFQREVVRFVASWSQG